MEQVADSGEVPQVLSVWDTQEVARGIPTVKEHVLEGAQSQYSVAPVEDGDTGPKVPESKQCQHDDKDEADADRGGSSFGSKNPPTGGDDALCALVDPCHPSAG